MTFDVAFDGSRVVDGRTVATLAARARIRELEESPEWTSARGSRQRDRKATGAASEIIELSIRYGLLSRETSFVAVERRETPVLGDMQLRRIPIALTSGWGGVEMMRGRSYGAVMGAPPAMMLGAPGAMPRRRRHQDMEHREASVPADAARRRDSSADDPASQANRARAESAPALGPRHDAFGSGSRLDAVGADLRHARGRGAAAR